MIQIDHLTFAYEERTVLDDIQLTVNQGEFWGLIGPNGSGKSTLVKCVLGLLKPQRGQIRVMGHPVRYLKPEKSIGYVSQKANSFNRGFPATVQEVVASGLYGKKGLFRRMGKKDWGKVDWALEQVGLIDLKKQNIGNLSGGQQQRAFIARALVAEPKLLVLDEPTVGIDAHSTDAFYEFLARLHREEGLTLLLVTHDIGVVSSYVDRVACLNKRLFFHGDSSDFVKRQEKILAEAYGHDICIISHQHE